MKMKLFYSTLSSSFRYNSRQGYLHKVCQKKVKVRKNCSHTGNLSFCKDTSVVSTCSSTMKLCWQTFHLKTRLMKKAHASHLCGVVLRSGAYLKKSEITRYHLYIYGTFGFITTYCIKANQRWVFGLSSLTNNALIWHGWEEITPISSHFSLQLLCNFILQKFAQVVT